METETVDGSTLESWTPEEVCRARDAREIVLIDVRSPQEFLFEHIEGALLMPLSGFDADALPTQAGKRIVFHCGSGVRSEKVARGALAAGFEPVAHMAGGFAAWKAAGLPHMTTDMATGGPKKVPRQV